MIASVLAALRDLGGLKCGTPLDTASTPVNAVHPEENARRSSATGTVVDRVLRVDAERRGLRGGVSPTTADRRPPEHDKHDHDEPVRGDREHLPPREPPQIHKASSATKPNEIGTACGARPGNADTMLATPATTDTATVST